MASSILTLEGFQRNLKKLQCSDLMASTEYANMYRTVNDYFDIGRSQLNSSQCSEDWGEGKEENVLDNAMAIDVCDKPFLYTLVKLLLDVNSQGNDDHRSENLQRVYQWYCANKRYARATQSRLAALDSASKRDSPSRINANVYPRTSPMSLLSAKEKLEHLLETKYGTGKTHLIPTASKEIRNIPTRTKWTPRATRCPPSSKRNSECEKQITGSSPSEMEESNQLDVSFNSRPSTCDVGIFEHEEISRTEDNRIKEVHEINTSHLLSPFEDFSKSKSQSTGVNTTSIIDVHIKRISSPGPSSPRNESGAGGKSPGREIFEFSKCNISPCREHKQIVGKNGVRYGKDENLHDVAMSASFGGKDSNREFIINTKHRIPSKPAQHHPKVLGPARKRLLGSRDGHSKHNLMGHRQTDEEKKNARFCSAGDVGKSGWVTEDTVFPSNHGYMNFTRSMRGKHDVSEAQVPRFSFRELTFPPTARKREVGFKTFTVGCSQRPKKEANRTSSKAMPQIKTAGQNITLTPRPPRVTTYVSRSSEFSRKSNKDSPPTKSSVNATPSPRSVSFEDDAKNEPHPATNSPDSLKREEHAAINIQKIFRGHAVRRHMKNLDTSHREREKRSASAKTLSASRQRQQAAQLKKVDASKQIYDIFHNPSNAEKNNAAIQIQRVFKGWYVRRHFDKCQSKIGMRSLSFRGFIHDVYIPHLIAIMGRHGNTSPKVLLQFSELLQYVNDRNKYEAKFEQTAVDGCVPFQNIKSYLTSCGLFPSKLEILTALRNVCKDREEDYETATYSKAEVVDMTFDIYIPKGTRLKDERKSTWMNPLIGGEEAIKLIGKKAMEDTNLEKCLNFVQETMRARSAQSTDLNK